MLDDLLKSKIRQEGKKTVRPIRLSLRFEQGPTQLTPAQQTLTEYPEIGDEAEGHPLRQLEMDAGGSAQDWPIAQVRHPWMPQ